MDFFSLLVSCIIHHVDYYPLRVHCAVMSDCCAHFPESRTGMFNPEQIPSPQTIHPFLRPTLSAGGGEKEDFFPGITDVGRLRGSLCFTIAAL